MGEGGTPLARLPQLPGLEGVRVYAKLESSNPTGSFKDRGMTVAVTIARASGARAVVVASTGNTAAAAAAYAARAGMRSIVLIPAGKVAWGKLAQTMHHGATIVEVDGSFDDALKAVMEAVERDELLYPLNSFNPWRLEGQKTIGFEIVDQLGGEAPDWIIVPVGNAGNISAIWKGLKELDAYGLLRGDLPRMAGIQAEGAAPLVEAWKKGLDEPIWFDKPETIATAIRIGRPVNWPKAMDAVRESGGVFEAVSDKRILEAHKLLARRAGIAVEPASAASLAGLIKLREEGIVERGDTVAIVLTGHGLKDPDTMRLGAPEPIRVGAGSAARLVSRIAREGLRKGAARGFREKVVVQWQRG